MSKLKNKSKVLALLMILSLVGIVFLLFTYTATSKYSLFKYAITIDAGSTHSKAILFKWKADKLNETGLIEQVKTCHIGRGIASYGQKASHLEKAAEDLVQCIHQLADHLDRATSLEHTFVYLGATAGMRMLNLTDPNASSHLFEAIRAKFSHLRVQTKRVSIITGKEEGLFAWVAVNYLSGTFFAQPTGSRPTYGVLDMGGASAQIAQQIPDSESGDSVHIRLYGTNYSLHTYSNFCFGTEQALKRYFKVTQFKHIKVGDNNSLEIEAPCLPRGVRMSNDKLAADNICTKRSVVNTNTSNANIEFVGTSNFEKCRQVVNEILDLQTCKKDFQFCFEESNHPKEGAFFAISAYYYLTDVLNLKNNLSNIDFYQYLNETRKICESSHDELKGNHRLSDKFITKYCFQLTYLHSTLTKVYHFDEKSWSNLRFTSTINDTYLGWVLGFMISESSAIPSEAPIAPILLERSLYTIPVCFLFFVFLICSVCFWKQCKKRPHEYNPPQVALNQVA